MLDVSAHLQMHNINLVERCGNVMVIMSALIGLPGLNALPDTNREG